MAELKYFDRVRQLIVWRRERGETELNRLKEIVDEYFSQEELSQGAHAWYRDIFQALEEESHVATIRP